MPLRIACTHHSELTTSYKGTQLKHGMHGRSISHPGVIILPIFIKAKCVHGLALPRVSHAGKIAQVGSCRLRSTLATVPVLFEHTAVVEINIGRIISPRAHLMVVW